MWEVRNQPEGNGVPAWGTGRRRVGEGQCFPRDKDRGTREGCPIRGEFGNERRALNLLGEERWGPLRCRFRVTRSSDCTGAVLGHRA